MIWENAMGGLSIWHWMLFAAVALLLFGGKGKISDIMGDVAKGVKSFKKGLSDDDEAKPAESAPVAPATPLISSIFWAFTSARALCAWTASSAWSIRSTLRPGILPLTTKAR